MNQMWYLILLIPPIAGIFITISWNQVRKAKKELATLQTKKESTIRKLVNESSDLEQEIKNRYAYYTQMLLEIEEAEEQRQQQMAQFNEDELKEILERQKCEEKAAELAIIKARMEYEQQKINIEVKIAEKDKEFKTLQIKMDSLIKQLQQSSIDAEKQTAYQLHFSSDEQLDFDLLRQLRYQFHNPTIISKIMWSEIVQKAYQDLARRTSIKTASGVYKITNVDDSKCYVGQSTDVYKRLASHLKTALGAEGGVAKQAIHEAMAQQGVNKWNFEVLCYCEKEELSQFERDYITMFKSNEYGYNRTKGG